MARPRKNQTIEAKVDPASLADLRRTFTRLAIAFPKESGRASRSLGRNVMQSMRTGLKTGSSRSKLVSFNGSWPRLNPLYVIMARLTGDNTFGGKLAGGAKGKGSPIGYFYDAAGMSVSVGMFRSAPGMRNAKQTQKDAIISSSAVNSFEKFLDGSARGAYSAAQRRAIIQAIIHNKGTPADIAVARREMSRPWVTAPRAMVDPMNSNSKAQWIAYIISQTNRIVRQKAGKAATA